MTHSTLRQHLGDKNIMAIDFESLSLANDAALPSCGIVIFNAVTKETVLEEEVLVNIHQQLDGRKLRSVSGTTLRWWIKQALENPEAAKATFRPDLSDKEYEAEALDIRGFCESLAATWDEFACGWLTSTGPQKDAVWLEGLMEQCGVVPPWRHNQVFDQRTLYLLNQNNVPKDLGREKGVLHRAKDDAAWVRDYILAVCEYEEKLNAPKRDIYAEVAEGFGSLRKERVQAVIDKLATKYEADQQ